MKGFIITVCFIILAVFLVNSYVSGDTDTMKSESTRIGNSMITDMQDVEKD